MENIEIKRVREQDVATLQQISRQTFVETFSAGNSAENLNKYLAEEFSLEKLQSEMNDKNSAFYFAVLNNNPVGYIKLNFGTAQTELKEDRGIEVERIYMLKEFQGKKAGQMLFESAIRIARQKEADYVWLGVWEENTKAIGFYRKNGFIEFDKHIFRLGNEEQTDLMMKLVLKENGG